MAKFENPVLVELDDISEGVFAAGSGGGDNPPPGTDTPPEVPYKIFFNEFDHSSYCTFFFQCNPISTKKYKKIHLDVSFNKGVLNNRFDKDGSFGNENHSGTVSNVKLDSKGNNVSIDLDLYRMNDTDDVNVKFDTRWFHDNSSAPSSNHGSYNGMQGSGHREDIVANGWASVKATFYER